MAENQLQPDRHRRLIIGILFAAVGLVLVRLGLTGRYPLENWLIHIASDVFALLPETVILLTVLVWVAAVIGFASVIYFLIRYLRNARHISFTAVANDRVIGSTGLVTKFFSWFERFVLGRERLVKTAIGSILLTGFLGLLFLIVANSYQILDHFPFFLVSLYLIESGLGHIGVRGPGRWLTERI